MCGDGTRGERKSGKGRVEKRNADVASIDRAAQRARVGEGSGDEQRVTTPS